MHTNCAPDRRLGISFIELLCATAVLSMVTGVTVARLHIRAEFNQARCTGSMVQCVCMSRAFTAIPPLH